MGKLCATNQSGTVSLDFVSEFDMLKGRWISILNSRIFDQSIKNCKHIVTSIATIEQGKHNGFGHD